VLAQFYDVCNIFQLNGMPSETNPYLFNGDFVDRGSFSIEVIMLFFSLKLLYPKSFHLLRGNHETLNMNAIYGVSHTSHAAVGSGTLQANVCSFRLVLLRLSLLFSSKAR
jgi:hypothetical protein